MNKPVLLRTLGDICFEGDASFLAEQIVRDLVDQSESFQDLYDNYPWEVESNLTYYSQAWNYLMDTNINDFEDAIKEYGATNITEIAYYYLSEEVSNIINELDNQTLGRDKE